MALAMVLGFATSALFAYRRKLTDEKSKPWPMAPLWGALLGLALWAAGTQLWGLNEVILNGNALLGTEQIWSKSLLGLALGLAVGLLVASHVRGPKHRWARRVRLFVLTGWLSLLLVAFVLYMLRTGVVDADAYPPREESPYLLPWPGGMTWICTQGNRAVISHRDAWSQYAYDFAMPIGSPVLAAREGIVTKVIDEYDGNSMDPDRPFNYVTILQPDGTYAEYVHIRHGGARVRKDERVRQGQLIAESGNVGFSTSPHLHFQVYVIDAQYRSIPVTFRDVTIRRGIPRMGLRYTSGNAALE
jgi:murein DD-endopeptidase MepM/ murein hydrolase activator NlpD